MSNAASRALRSLERMPRSHEYYDFLYRAVTSPAAQCASTLMSIGPQLLIGTYTSGRAAIGAYLCALNDGGQVQVRGVCAIDDPSFLIRHPNLPVAYAVNESPQGHGGVSVLGIDVPNRRIEVLQRVEAGGEAPCHVALADDASGLIVAHYGCGTVQWLGLNASGRLTGESRDIRHKGASARRRRQASAHPHCVVVRGDHVYVTDLGMDCIVRYAIDARHGFIERDRTLIHPGAGPRHLCFAKKHAVAYVGNELDNSVSTLSVADDGTLTEREWCSSLPPGCAERSAIGEVTLHPNGRWLYASNRGFDSIVWFNVGADGALSFADVVSSQGQHPRHFSIAPDGRQLVVANRDSNNLVSYKIDQRSGALLALGVVSTDVPAPVCVCWV